MNKNKIKLITSVLVSLVIMTGCTSENDTKTEDIQNKNEIVISVIDEPQDGFDATTSDHGSLTNLIFSTLFKRCENLEIEGDLATEYITSEDKLTWTVNLREDAVFSDGTKLTAKDVVYSYEQAKSSGSTMDLTILDSVKEVDEYSVEFKLNKVQSTFIEKMTDIGIVPKEKHNENFANNPIGSGPYKLIQWDKGQQMIFEVNENYYEDTANIKKVTLVFLDVDSAFAAVNSGDVDLAKISASLAEQKVENTKLYELDSIETYGVAYPMNKENNKVTSDRAIREALTIAVDREKLVSGLLGGYGDISTTGLENMAWLNEETILTENYDIEKAKKILDDAGWKDTNNNGVIDKDGIEAEFDLLYTEGIYRQELALMFEQSAKELGIDVNINLETWDTMGDKIDTSAVVYGWGSADPSQIYSMYSSEVIDNAAVWNNSGKYSNEVVDEYMRLALESKDEEEALKYWKLAQYDGKTGFSSKGDIAYTWLVNVNHLYLANENLDLGSPSIQPHGGRIFDNISEWSIK